MMPYGKFKAWQLAHQLALQVYEATDSWPKEECFGLTIQLRRAPLSVPTNISEGAAKRGNRELRRFLDIALGSLSEVSYLLLFSRDRGLLMPAAWLQLNNLRNRVGQLTWQLYPSISRHAQEIT